MPESLDGPRVGRVVWRNERTRMADQAPRLTQEEVARLYGALRSELNKRSVQQIRNTAAAAGIDVSQITAKAGRRADP